MRRSTVLWCGALSGLALVALAEDRWQVKVAPAALDTIVISLSVSPDPDRPGEATVSGSYAIDTVGLQGYAGTERGDLTALMDSIQDQTKRADMKKRIADLALDLRRVSAQKLKVELDLRLLEKRNHE